MKISLPTSGPVVLSALVFALALETTSTVRAGVFNVDTTNDTHAVDATASALDSAGHTSLRSAIEAANAQTGEMVINVPAGSYNLTLGELSVAPNGGKAITLGGAGSTATLINQTDGTNRVFNIDINSSGGTTVTLSSLGISGGRDQADQLGGAGILAGSVASTPPDNLILKDCQVRDNRCVPPNGGYARVSSGIGGSR